MKNSIQLNNKQDLRLLTNEINQALKLIGDKYGLNLNTKSGRYELDGSEFSVKLVVKNTTVQKNYDMECVILGLPKTIIGSSLSLQGKDFVITGLNTRKPKFPVEVKCLNDQKNYGLTVSAVKKVLAIQ
jgi:hypothetical protein